VRDGKNTTIWKIVKMLVIMDDIEAICTNAVLILRGYITTIKKQAETRRFEFLLVSHDIFRTL
jgi:hypothetical protein